MSELEHVNVTVADPQATAAMLCDLFGWQIRWQGDSLAGGYSMHVGSAGSYVAIYAPSAAPAARHGSSYETRGALNHIGVVVGDLDAVERKVEARGYEPHSHADYEPGRRFYFREENGIEIEVVQYD